MADRSIFFGIYEANFGSAPEMESGIAEAEWAEFIESIPHNLLRPMFERVSANWKSVAYKPRLQQFRHALREARGFKGKEVKPTDTALGAEFCKYDALAQTPLFDFNREGNPRSREALLNELPKQAYKDVFQALYAMMRGEITPTEATDIWAGCYQPQWKDYSEDEKRQLEARWGRDQALPGV